MPRNRQSEARKQAVLGLVWHRIGPTQRKHPTRPDWHVSKDESVEVFITDSKSTDKHAPWYDMRKTDIDELASRPAAFIIFILGDQSRYLVAPASQIAAQLQKHSPPTDNGFYHFHIVRGKSEFKEFPAWNIKPYVDNMSQIPLQVTFGNREAAN